MVALVALAEVASGTYGGFARSQSANDVFSVAISTQVFAGIGNTISVESPPEGARGAVRGRCIQGNSDVDLNIRPVTPTSSTKSRTRRWRCSKARDSVPCAGRGA
jgi:hypothetical protein